MDEEKKKKFINDFSRSVFRIIIKNINENFEDEQTKIDVLFNVIINFLFNFVVKSPDESRNELVFLLMKAVKEECEKHPYNKGKDL